MQRSSNERFNQNLYLTTSEAGELVGLHASTIKRLCDDGGIPHDTTEGGHRRIYLQDALELARERGSGTFLDPFTPYEGHVWTALRSAETHGAYERIRSLAYSWLLMERLDLLRPLLRVTGRRPGIPYPVFLDEVVREFMRRIGESWREGRLGVGAEHEATEIVTDLLHGLREEWVDPADSDGASSALGPTSSPGMAVVGGLEKNRHELGPLSIRLLLERSGWTVIYLGSDVPLEEIAEIQLVRGADLVCLSVGSVDGKAGAVRALRLLALLYREQSPYAIALGGEDLTAEGILRGSLPFEDVGVFSGALEFQDWLEARPTREDPHDDGSTRSTTPVTPEDDA